MSPRSEPRHAGAVSPPFAASREEALARAGPIVAAAYRLVRELVDELDAAAPWSLLYDPPRAGEPLAAAAEAMISLVGGLGAHATSLRDSDPCVDSAVIDTFELYVAGIAGMLTPDLQRLAGQRAKLGKAPTRAAAEGFAELLADLKGKLSSALMAAAANLASERTSAGPLVEPLLFPEKESERRQTSALVPALAELVAAVRGLGEELAPAGLVAGWRAGKAADPYALAALPALEARLAALLRPATRRALYAGDYHELRRRERRVSRRIHEALELHAATWEHPGAGDRAGKTSRIVAATLEIAALVDVQILDGLIGADSLAELRRRIFAGEGPDGLATELHGVLPLLADEDLRTFVELLHGSVRKRAALQTATAPAPGGTPAGAPEPPVVSAQQRTEAARQLDALLAPLVTAANPRWGSFRMVGRLLQKGGAVPTQLLEQARPFVAELRRELEPHLHLLDLLGPLPPELAESFADDLALVERTDLGPLETRQRMPAAMGRLERVLDALRGAVSALARGSRQADS